MLTQLFMQLEKRRVPVVMALAVLTIAAAWYAAQIRFDFTPQAIFGGSGDVVEYAEQFKETFGYEDSLLLVVLEATGSTDVLDARALTWQARIARSLSRVPDVEQVESLVTIRFVPHRVIRPPWIVMTRLLKGTEVDQEQEAAIRAQVDQFSFLNRSLLSADRRMTVIMLRLEPSARSIERTCAAIDAVQATVRLRLVPAGYKVWYTGLPAIRARVVDDLERDQWLFVPVAAGLGILIMTCVFRRPVGALLPLVAVGTGVTWTMAVLVLAGKPFDIITNILPVLLLIIGMSNCVHIVCRYGEEMEKEGVAPALRGVRTMSHMALPCLLTYTTTAVGFLSLMAARSGVLRALGWEAAVGFSLLFLATMLWFGTLLQLFRPPVNPVRSGDLRFGRSRTWRGQLPTDHAVLTLLVGGGLLAAAIVSGRRVVVNAAVLEAYADDHPVSRQMKTMEDQFAGFVSLEVSLASSKPDQFFEPRVYRRVARAVDFIRREAAVLRVVSYVDLHQEVYARLKRRPELRDELPTDDDRGRRRLARARRIVLRSAGSLSRGSFLSPDGRRARIKVLVRDVGTRKTLRMIRRIEARLAALFPRDDGVEFRLTGDAYLNAVLLDSFVRDLLFSLAGASGVIFALIGGLFRSVRYGLIAVVPNLTPLVLTLGYMGVRGYDMTVANVIVFAISLGVAVDDTIHFLARFSEERRAGYSVRESIFRTWAGTGRAIVLTTLLIMVGTFVLMWSSFLPTRRFAELVSVTMLGALVGDLVLLPACLSLFARRGPGADAPPLAGK